MHKNKSVTGIFHCRSSTFASRQDFVLVYFTERKDEQYHCCSDRCFITKYHSQPNSSLSLLLLPSCRAVDVGLLRLKVQRGLQLHPAQGAEAVLRLGAETRLRLQQHVHEAVRPVESADAEIPQSSQPGR